MKILNLKFKNKKPKTPSLRHTKLINKSVLIKKKSFKNLIIGKKKNSGRNNLGRITSFTKGGGNKKLYRFIGFMWSGFYGILKSVEYDPNRSGLIGCVFNLFNYNYMYILLPNDIVVGHIVESHLNKSSLYSGHQYDLKNVPIGTIVYNLNNKYCKSAGTCGIILQHKNFFTLIKLPSTTIVTMNSSLKICIGSVSNSQWKYQNLGKAGRKRNLGYRPKVRGIAMNPVDHPHGGRTNGGRPPVSPWGKSSKGGKTSNKKLKKV